MKHGIPVSRIVSPDGEHKDGYAYPWDAFGFCEINVDYKDATTTYTIVDGKQPTPIIN